MDSPILANCSTCDCHVTDSRPEKWRGLGPDVGPSIEIIGWRKVDGRWLCPGCAGLRGMFKRAIRTGLASEIHGP